MANVVVDAENVRRSLWPNMPGDELEERSKAWGEEQGHQGTVVWEGNESGDDQIVRRVQRPHPPAGHLIAEVRPGRSLALHSRPFGRVLARVGSRTPFGSPRALGVVARQHGRWLAVTEAGVGNNRSVWVDARAGGLRY